MRRHVRLALAWVLVLAMSGAWTGEAAVAGERPAGIPSARGGVAAPGKWTHEIDRSGRRYSRYEGHRGSKHFVLKLYGSGARERLVLVVRDGDHTRTLVATAEPAVRDKLLVTVTGEQGRVLSRSLEMLPDCGCGIVTDLNGGLCAATSPVTCGFTSLATGLFCAVSNLACSPVPASPPCPFIPIGTQAIVTVFPTIVRPGDSMSFVGQFLKPNTTYVAYFYPSSETGDNSVAVYRATTFATGTTNGTFQVPNSAPSTRGTMGEVCLQEDFNPGPQQAFAGAEFMWAPTTFPCCSGRTPDGVPWSSRG